jgi:ATP synthase protein I
MGSGRLHRAEKLSGRPEKKIDFLPDMLLEARRFGTGTVDLSDDKKKKPFFNYDKNRDWTENFALVMQTGLTMVGSIMFCFFIGLYLDRWLGTRGLFLIIGLLLGIAGGGVTAYRQIMDMLKDKHKKD